MVYCECEWFPDLGAQPRGLDGCPFPAVARIAHGRADDAGNGDAVQDEGLDVCERHLGFAEERIERPFAVVATYS